MIEESVCAVVPVYNSEKTIETVVKKLRNVLKQFSSYQIVLVDDKSLDGSLFVLHRLQKEDENICVIALEKNAGQQSAVLCGLRASKCNYTVIIDDDLEHEPDDILKLYRKAQEGYDVVYGLNDKNNSCGVFRNFGALLRDRLIHKLTGLTKDKKVCSFRIINKQTVSKVTRADTKFVYISLEILKHTKNIENVRVDYNERKASGYHLFKLIDLMLKMLIYYLPIFKLFRRHGKAYKVKEQFRLMVLGGGSCQLNLLERAKKMGYYVILADYLEDCVGAKIADVHELISTFDTKAICRAAKKHNIDGIITLGTDQPVLSAAATAQMLGLNFYVDKRTALAVTNKRIMKALFTKHDIPTVKYALIGENFIERQIGNIRFPVVLKPVDSQGQKGIFLVHSMQEVRAHLPQTLRFSREKKALLEEYYFNDEITVNGWVHEGRAKIISVVDRVTIKNDTSLGVCLCHNFPSLHWNARNIEIEELTQRIVDAFGIKQGPLYFQYLIGKDGIKVNEIAMRIGGAYEDLTIPMLSGIDILGMQLEYNLYGSCDLKELNTYKLSENDKFFSTQLFFCRPGIIDYITPQEYLLKLKGIRKVYYTVKQGEQISVIKNAGARAGYIIIEGESFADMVENVNNVFNNIKVLDKSGKNLVIKYEEYKEKYRFVGENDAD